MELWILEKEESTWSRTKLTIWEH
nr:unnamed protein product [Callosobruchus chinensis]